MLVSTTVTSPKEILPFHIVRAAITNHISYELLKAYGIKRCISVVVRFFSINIEKNFIIPHFINRIIKVTTSSLSRLKSNGNRIEMSLTSIKII
jgi:hypothetical protein